MTFGGWGCDRKIKDDKKEDKAQSPITKKAEKKIDDKKTSAITPLFNHL